MGGVYQFQITYGERIHPNVLLRLNPRDMGDMLNLGMLGFKQVMHGRPSGNNAERQILHSEAFQGMHLKMAQEQGTGEICREHPVLESGAKVLLSETAEKRFAFAFLHHHLRRGETLQQLADIIVRTLGNVELSGGNVQQSQAAHVLLQVHTAKEIVPFGFQHLVIIGNARRNQFRHSALH